MLHVHPYVSSVERVIYDDHVLTSLQKQHREKEKYQMTFNAVAAATDQWWNPYYTNADIEEAKDGDHDVVSSAIMKNT